MDIVAERGKTYGGQDDGYANLRRIAQLWSAYLGHPVTAHDVSWLMVLMKASRSRQDPAHLDNYTDARGYADLAERLR